MTLVDARVGARPWWVPSGCGRLPATTHRRALEHALVRSAGAFVQMEHGPLASFGVDPELQVQLALLEYLHAVRPHAARRAPDVGAVIIRPFE